MNIVQVKNPAVWKSLKVLFMAAPLIFLINIYFGFDNALTAGAIPRWQLLTHLHAGSVGWITLSAIGVAVWVLTGQRDVSAGYEKFVTGLIWAAVIAFGLYVPLFGLAFSRPGGLLVTLHPVLGAAAVIILWTSATPTRKRPRTHARLPSRRARAPGGRACPRSARTRRDA